MKKILTGAFILALTIGTANAQTNAAEKHKGHQRENKMNGYKNLNLSPDQKARMKTIHADFKKQEQDLKKQDNLTVAEMKKRQEALHKSFRTQSETILTADQKATLAKNTADWKAKNKDGKRAMNKDEKGMAERKNSAGEKGVNRQKELQKDLTLTADQQTKMKEIRTDYKAKLESVRADNSLTQDQKKEKGKELMKSEQQAMKTVLTKEQMEKMQAARKEHGGRNTK